MTTYAADDTVAIGIALKRLEAEKVKALQRPAPEDDPVYLQEQYLAGASTPAAPPATQPAGQPSYLFTLPEDYGDPF